MKRDLIQTKYLEIKEKEIRNYADTFKKFLEKHFFFAIIVFV